MKAFMLELLGVGAIVASLYGVVATAPDEPPPKTPAASEVRLAPSPPVRPLTFARRCGHRAPN